MAPNNDVFFRQRVIGPCDSLEVWAKFCVLAQYVRSGKATPDDAYMSSMMCKEIEDTGHLQTFGGPLERIDLDWILSEAYDQYIPDQGDDVNWMTALGIEVGQEELNKVRKSTHVLACEGEGMLGT